VTIPPNAHIYLGLAFLAFAVLLVLFSRRGKGAP